MLELGYALSSEEMPPSDLVRFAQEGRRDGILFRTDFRPLSSLLLSWRSGNQRTSPPFEE